MPSGTRERAMAVAQQGGASLLHGFERGLLRSSAVPTSPFLPTDTFPWIATLEAGWTTGRADLDLVLEHRAELPNFQDISVDQESITADDGWKTYFFVGYGF